jgi:SAM-dependent methyltransferase
LNREAVRAAVVAALATANAKANADASADASAAAVRHAVSDAKAKEPTTMPAPANADDRVDAAVDVAANAEPATGATDAAAPRCRDVRDWRAFERFGHVLMRAPWRLATTMPHNPHHYTQRAKWPSVGLSDAHFVRAVEYLRAAGYRARFEGRAYTQLDVNEHFYWTMGAPLDQTILINRKPTPADGVAAPYDAIAARYDELCRTPQAEAEHAAVFEAVRAAAPGPLGALGILDVGCGSGLLLRHLGAEQPRRYLGLDPSGAMLELLRHRHPDAAVVRTPLASFVPPALGFGGSDAGGLVSENRYSERYDLVLALHGVGSYLTGEELARIPTLLAPGGRAVVMFYVEGHTPETYRKAKVTPPSRPWRPEALPDVFSELLVGEPVRIGNHVLLVIARC